MKFRMVNPRPIREIRQELPEQCVGGVKLATTGERTRTAVNVRQASHQLLRAMDLWIPTCLASSIEASLYKREGVRAP